MRYEPPQQSNLTPRDDKYISICIFVFILLTLVTVFAIIWKAFIL